MKKVYTLGFSHVLLLLILGIHSVYPQQGVVIPTGKEQNDFLKTYRFALDKSSVDYRFTSSTIDTVLFPRWGEHSMYWVKSGSRRGSLIYPDVIPSAYSSISATGYTDYDWRTEQHYALAFKAYANAVGIFRSSIRNNNNSVSWEAVYFKNLFDSHMLNGISYYISEREIDSVGISWTTQFLVFPAVAVNGTDWRFFIDSMFTVSPRLKDRLIDYLKRGGTIYTEGNGVYLMEKLGLLPPGSIDYAQGILPDPETGSITLDIAETENPVSFTKDAAGSTIYTGMIPLTQTGNAEVIARSLGSNIPVVFAFSGASAHGGRIICNTALPTVGGSNAVQSGASQPECRQLQWVLNSLLYAFASHIDVTRSVFNEIPDSLSAGRNAVSHDRCDTLEIRVKIRNLSSTAITGVEIKEAIRDYFRFVDVQTQGITYTYKKPYLTLTDLSIPGHSEATIVYRIATPDPDDAIHQDVNRYISWATYIYASIGIISYADVDGWRTYRKYRNYVDMMFSARIIADTDLNWKNFLGLYYQPFKIFMMMENKERTPAMGTRYVQYVPKDVPFYRTDKTLDIPILKTPGGKYVDILKGSSDERFPEYDMDADGHPDAWLDTASIYPKNYTLEETEVYWLNPWEHLRSGNTTLYEDIDHDGLRAQDLDGDGIVDVEEPGDKIRVWKITWDIGKVPGYQFFDPYCYFELWVDPPNLVPMSAGVGQAYGTLDQNVPGMFYPYSPDLQNPKLADTSWTHWMERDASGNIIWKQLIYQSIHNYEGFTFIDTLRSGYAMKSTDRCAGTVPQPHREFIAVLSLGGEEIDMKNPTPEKSEYSNLEYVTIFGEKRNTPIRTTYSYYAPLPNPLQFEYLTNNFTITDILDGKVLKHLPAYGKAHLTFDIDASTEYSYYWIRNAGHDVDHQDPSFLQEGIEELGDGVFGYMIYDIPKGMGGYSITLPKLPDGQYDIDRIVQVDGRPYHSWIDNPNTADSIQILEDPFMYHVFIPQLLIPPALDDDNADGVDDWIDDRGDRFQSKTGFLHDHFMLGNGEDYPDYPKEPFKDDIYGWVTSGWYDGPDGTYGDDFFEALGKRHFTINALYEGTGREGSVDISKGGWLVVEEIFGGSPWVLFSHSLSAFAQGVNYSLVSSVTPSVARYGIDTVYVRHVVEDQGEPHLFDMNFDPFMVSYGYGKATITTHAGGKDPCGLIEPATVLSTIIDPVHSRREYVLVPQADPLNPDLKDYPKRVSGSFVLARIEVSNGTDWNWINTTIIPSIPRELGATKLVMSYVAYPRPLVPAQVDPVTGRIIHAGDDPGSFRTGWRFNQPEGEVIIKMGNALNLIQPSRRAYFMFLFSVDESLGKGIYEIDFILSGEMRKYDGTLMGRVGYDVPSCMFSISPRDASGNVIEYQKLVIGQGSLKDIRTSMTAPYFKGLGDARWSTKNVQYTDFDTLWNFLGTTYSPETGIETIDLSRFDAFPTVEATRLYVLEKGEVTSTLTNDKLTITKAEELRYDYQPFGTFAVSSKPLSISTVGPKLVLFKSITGVNGQSLEGRIIPEFLPGEEKEVSVRFDITNLGSSIAENVILHVESGSSFAPIVEKLPPNCRIDNTSLEASCASILPGETRQLTVRYGPRETACERLYDTSTVVRRLDALYRGMYSLSGKYVKDLFTVPDDAMLELPAYDVQVEALNSTHREIRHGQTIGLSATCANGVVPVQDLSLGFYAAINDGDTLLIGSQSLSDIGAHARFDASVTFTVPDSTQFIEFFVVADPPNRYGEFCEFNNIQSLKLPLRDPDWIFDVVNYPNPIRDETVISYFLPRDVRRLKLMFYTLDAKQIGKELDSPGSMGRHSVVWRDPLIPAGTYMYSFEAVDERGETRRHTGRFVKVR